MRSTEDNCKSMSCLKKEKFGDTQLEERSVGEHRNSDRRTLERERDGGSAVRICQSSSAYVFCGT